MNKPDFLLATIVAVGEMLAVIPNDSITHVAKASTCSFSANGGSGSLLLRSISGAVASSSSGVTGAGATSPLAQVHRLQRAQ
jgi:hypothetical protein